jgi:hypothetical protein
MRKATFPLALLVVLAACGSSGNGGGPSSTVNGSTSGGSTSGGSTSGGTTTGAGATSRPGASSGAPNLSTLNSIYDYLVGKTFVETGADIPPFPYGWDENANNDGSASGGACFNKQSLQFTTMPGTWALTQTFGTLTGAVVDGSAGTCDTSTAAGSPVGPAADVFSLQNLQGSGACFDIDVTIAAESGRGTISSDGKTMSLELYHHTLYPSGHRCANGAVGGTGVALNGTPFTGNAVQVWRLQ